MRVKEKEATYFVVKEGKKKPVNVRLDHDWIIPTEPDERLPQPLKITGSREIKTVQGLDRQIVVEKSGKLFQLDTEKPSEPEEKIPKANVLGGFERRIRGKIIDEYQKAHEDDKNYEGSPVLSVLAPDRRGEIINGVSNDLSKNDKRILRGIIQKLQSGETYEPERIFLNDLRKATETEPEIVKSDLNGLERKLLDDVWMNLKKVYPEYDVESKLFKVLASGTHEEIIEGIGELPKREGARILQIIVQMVQERKIKKVHEDFAAEILKAAHATAGFKPGGDLHPHERSVLDEAIYLHKRAYHNPDEAEKTKLFEILSYDRKRYILEDIGKLSPFEQAKLRKILAQIEESGEERSEREEQFIEELKGVLSVSK